MTKDKRQLTLILSVVFSGFGPLATGIAFMLNTSTTQFADFIRRSAELGVLVLALWTYVHLKKTKMDTTRKHRFQQRVYIASATVLMLSALLLVYLFIHAIINPARPEGNVYLGLAIASLGLLFNGYFWFRYKAFHEEKASPIMDSQGVLYQTKTIADLSVVIALGSVIVFQSRWSSYWIDTIGTLVLATYLVVRSVLLYKKTERLIP